MEQRVQTACECCAPGVGWRREKRCYPEKSSDVAETRLPAYLLSLQGVRWGQHHQALPERLACLLHQRGQGLPGAQQVPEDKHKTSGIRFLPSLGEGTGLVCRGSGLGNVSGLRQEGDRVGHAGQRQKQLKRKRWLGTQVIQTGRGGCVRSSRSNRKGPGMGSD